MPGAICVYCASSMGTNPAYEQSAKSLGAALAKSSRPLIYGGGKMGIMGVVSQAVLDNGGHVTGVSPYAMVARGGEGSKTNTANGTAGFEDKISSREAAPHPNRVSIVVGSMHERKTELAKLADGGFVALPGGYGTFEELLEVTTWSQLAIHVKPIIIVNVLNYYGSLREQIIKGIEAGFIKEENLNLVTFVDGPENLEEHATFDWGVAVMKVLDEYKPSGWKGFGFDWTAKPNKETASPLSAI